MYGVVLYQHRWCNFNTTVFAVQFLWFLKNYLLRFHRTFSFLTQANLCCCFDVLDKITIANLRLNMTHFDALKFSECRSEEVMSFFWHLV